MPKNTINRVIENLNVSRRRKVIYSSDLKVLKEINNKNPETSLIKTASVLINTTGEQVCHIVINNVHNNNRVFAYSSIKKPLLSPKNNKSRIVKTGRFIFMSDGEIKRSFLV